MEEKIFLTQTELSERWRMSPRTLERWRWLGQGPTFFKISGNVLYDFSTIQSFEENQLRNSTSDMGQNTSPKSKNRGVR